nr:MAG TPA: hypothetical protein [Bacteriophage sp.]
MRKETNKYTFTSMEEILRLGNISRRNALTKFLLK